MVEALVSRRRAGGGGLALLAAVPLILLRPRGASEAAFSVAIVKPAAARGCLDSRGAWRGRGQPRRRRRPTRAESGEIPAAPRAEEQQLSSVTQSVVNLVKNIVGAGMLSLPAGVAAFSGSPKALLPAVALVVIFGLFSAYGFVLIANACRVSGKDTYQEVWAELVSPGSKWLISLACIANAGVGCICFSMILGDCLSLILAPLQLPLGLGGRTSCIALLTAVVLWPLCNMRSLAPLAKFSALGVASNFYIGFFILWRLFDGSYGRQGALVHAAPIAPKFSVVAGSAWSTAMTPGLLVLVSILGTAFLAHYNAALFYKELQPSPSGSKSGRFLLVSVLGFSAAAAIYSLVMVGGYMTFGSSCSGLILNNYSATDGLATVARVAIGLSLTTSYPIVFFSVREQFFGVLEAMGMKDPEATLEHSAVTTLLLVAITAVALVLRDLGRLAGFAGALFGIFLIYIAPPVMALRAARRDGAASSGGLRRHMSAALQILLIPLGVGLGAIGAVQCLR